MAYKLVILVMQLCFIVSYSRSLSGHDRPGMFLSEDDVAVDPRGDQTMAHGVEDRSELGAAEETLLVQSSRNSEDALNIPMSVGQSEVPMSLGLEEVPMKLGLNEVPMKLGLNEVPMKLGLKEVPMNVGLNEVPMNLGLDEVPMNLGLNEVPMNLGLNEVAMNLNEVPMNVGLKDDDRRK